MRFVFDLDGTICTQEKSGEYHLAKPIKLMVKRVNELYNAGHHIIIYTARGMTTFRGNIDRVEEEYAEMTRDWLIDNNVGFHELEFGKPAADVYVDDKGLSPYDFLEQHHKY